MCEIWLPVLGGVATCLYEQLTLSMMLSDCHDTRCLHMICVAKNPSAAWIFVPLSTVIRLLAGAQVPCAWRWMCLPRTPHDPFHLGVSFFDNKQKLWLSFKTPQHMVPSKNDTPLLPMHAVCDSTWFITTTWLNLYILSIAGTTMTWSTTRPA